MKSGEKEKKRREGLNMGKSKNYYRPLQKEI